MTSPPNHLQQLNGNSGMGMKNKKRLYKILGIAAACIALIIFFLWRYADSMVTKFADTKLQELSANSDSFKFSYSKLDISFVKGTIKLSDVTFSKDSISASAKRVMCGGLHPLKAWRSRKLLLDYVRADGVKLRACLIEKAKSDSLSVDSVSSSRGGLQKYLDTIGISKAIINGEEISVKRLKDSLKIELGKINAKAFGLGYSVASSKISFCDSLYDLTLKGVAFTNSNGLYAINLDTLSTRNSGSVSIKNFHGRNTVAKKELSSRKGNVPVTWTNLKIKELHTSNVNLIRVIQEKKIEIDSVFITGDQVNTFRDSRHYPKVPFKMPQESLASISIPIHVGGVKLTMPYFKMEVMPMSGSGGVGAFNFHDVDATISNITNKVDSTIKVHMRPRLGKGKGDLHLNLTLDKNSTFTAKAVINNINGSDLETFLHPVFGVKMAVNISKLNTSLKGNKNSIGGSFCMQYTGLQVKIDKDKAPKKLEGKAGLINTFSGAAIFKENPRENQSEPYTCTISVKRNPMKNYGSYMVSAMLDGVEKTVLRKLALKEVSKMSAKGKKN